MTSHSREVVEYVSHCCMLHNHNRVPECGQIIETVEIQRCRNIEVLDYRDVGLERCWIREMLD